MRRRWPCLVGAVGLAVVTAAPSALPFAGEPEPPAQPAVSTVAVDAPAELGTAVAGPAAGSGLACPRQAVALMARRPTPSAPTAAEHGHGKRARALRRAGWVVPEELTGGYALDEIRTLEDPATPHGLLQLVYVRDDARVSVFQRPGGLEDDAMLAGAEPVRGQSAWRWPEADPPRCAWESEGIAYVAVGGASSPDLDRAVQALPSPDGSSTDRPLLQRLLRLLERWLSLLR